MIMAEMEASKSLSAQCEGIRGNKHPLYDETWAEYADRNGISFMSDDEKSCRSYISAYEAWHSAKSEKENNNSGNQGGSSGQQESGQNNESQKQNNQSSNTQQRENTQAAPSSVRNSLRNDISRLEDECFGDLPIVQQRMMKSYAMMANSDTYTYEPIKSEQDKYINCFADNSPQVQTAQKLVDKIVKKMMSGNSMASKKLKEFMKDKKIKVHVINTPEMDAGCDGFNDKTKELHLTFCSGCFMYQKQFPDIANEDKFAVTLGHEIGHEIEHQNRGQKCSERATNHHTNGREVESFCDMFGLACAASAGYNLQSYIDGCEAFEDKELAYRIKEGKMNEPHPFLIHRKRLAKMAKQAYNNDMKERTLFSDEITSMEWRISEKETKQKAANLATLKAQKETEYNH